MEAASIVLLWYPRELADAVYAHWTVGRLRARLAEGPLGTPDVCYDEGLTRLLDDWIARGQKEAVYARLPWATPEEALLGYELVVDATLQRAWRAEWGFFLHYARALIGDEGAALNRAALAAACAASRAGTFDWHSWPPLAALVAADAPALDWERWQQVVRPLLPARRGWRRMRPEQVLRQDYERFLALREYLLAGDAEGLQLAAADSEEHLCPYPVPMRLRTDLARVADRYRAVMDANAARRARQRRVLRVVAPVIIVGLALIYTAVIVLALPGGALWWIPLVALVLAVLFWLMRRPAE
jgi:hypothetical protein